MSATSYPEWKVVFLQNKGRSKERRKSGVLDAETSNQVKDGWDGSRMSAFEENSGTNVHQKI